MKNFWPSLLVLIILVGIAYAAFVYGKSHPSPIATNDQTISEPVFPNISTAGWKTYTNTKYGYSFKYPNDWEIQGGINISDSSRVILDLPGTAAALRECVKNTDETNLAQCGPTQTGSEFFHVIVSPAAGYDQQLTKHLAFDSIKTQPVTLNGLSATFYIDPVITEHYYWDIHQNDKVYSVASITKIDALDMMPNDPQLATEYQQTALAIANTFTLK